MLKLQALQGRYESNPSYGHSQKDMFFSWAFGTQSVLGRMEVQAMGEGGLTMTNHEATEQAYKKGYEDGKPKWISVKDRLPEIIGSYLVVVKCKYDYENEYEIDTDVATYNPYEPAYIDDCWNTYIDWDEGQQYIHVTHWMPLPEPPKGE